MGAALITMLAILAYVWLVYPGVLLLIWRKRKTTTATVTEGAALPSVAVVISARNEETVIGSRITNLMALDYPRHLLQIQVGVDGVGDRTGAIAREWATVDPRVHVTSREICAGKAAMLKSIVQGLRQPDGVAGISSPAALLVFTDANTLFDADALRRLVAPFADPQVGGVCGRLILGAGNGERGAGSGERGAGTDEPLYWDLETRLKEAESRVDSCLGANGGIYAIRTELFPAAMPDNTIIDDFVIGMKVREQGFRMVYEAAAIAREDLPGSVAAEWKRRVRIGAGAYQALGLCRACLLPRYGLFAWMFWSHKLLRWLTPHLMIVMLLAGGWWLAVWWWRTEDWVVNLAGVGATLAFLTFMVLVETMEKVGKFYDRLAYFMMMQAALLVGFVKFCRGNLEGTWERTERGGGGGS